MSLITKDFDQIVEEILQKIIDANIGLTNVNSGSVLRTLVEVLADNDDMFNYYINKVYDNMNINNCKGDDLDNAAAILGLTKNSAKYAVGQVTLSTGSEPAEYDIEIPSGFIVSTRPDNSGNVKEFSIIDTDAVLAAGDTSINVTVECTESGLIHIPAGSISVMSRSLQGIHSVVNASAINGGTNVENDEDFRVRIKAVKETFGKCTDDALQSAVMEVSGVASCVVNDRIEGNGTTGIIVVADTMPPPQSVVDNVITAVNNTKASGIYAIIVYADTKFVDISIEINSDNNANIIDAINGYCNSLQPGQTFIVRQMERKVLNTVDKTEAENDDIDVTTVLPLANVTSTSSEIIRAGNITINGVLVQEVG